MKDLKKRDEYQVRSHFRWSSARELVKFWSTHCKRADLIRRRRRSTAERDRENEKEESHFTSRQVRAKPALLYIRSRYLEHHCRTFYYTFIFVPYPLSASLWSHCAFLPYSFAERIVKSHWCTPVETALAALSTARIGERACVATRTRLRKREIRNTYKHNKKGEIYTGSKLFTGREGEN